MAQTVFRWRVTKLMNNQTKNWFYADLIVGQIENSGLLQMKFSAIQPLRDTQLSTHANKKKSMHLHTHKTEYIKFFLQIKFVFIVIQSVLQHFKFLFRYSTNFQSILEYIQIICVFIKIEENERKRLISPQCV